MLVRQFAYKDQVKMGIYVFPEVPIKIYGAGYFLDYLSEKQFYDLLSDFRWGKKQEVDKILNFIGRVDKHLVKVWVGYYFSSQGKIPTRRLLIDEMCSRRSDNDRLCFRLEQKLPARYIRRSFGRDENSNTKAAKTFKQVLDDYKITQEELVGRLWKELLVEGVELKNQFYLGRSGVINMLGFYAAGYHGINMLNSKYKYLL